MKHSHPMGMNRTGLQMSPLNSKAMLDFEGRRDANSIAGSVTTSEAVRSDYIVDADNLGSVALPGNVQGAVQVGMALLKGNRPQILLDKLGERLAFERTGTRLYDAMITKCRSMHDDTISMSTDDLQQIRLEEARHMLLVSDAIEELGGDPTSQTPSADLAGIESAGLVQVLNDPRTSIAQCLHALVAAELSDKAGWETLVALAHEHNKPDMAADFHQALQKEREHLVLVQAWHDQALGLTFGEAEEDDIGVDDGDGVGNDVGKRAGAAQDDTAPTL